MTKPLVAAAFLLLSLWVYDHFASEATIPERETFESFPSEVAGWSCTDPMEIDDDTMVYLGATDYLLCDFHRADGVSPVNVYVGYHATQVREGSGQGTVNAIHPPEHCMPGSGWDIVEAGVVPLDVPGLPPGHGLGASGPEAKRFVIAKGDARQLVYFWYQTQSRVIARNTDVIFFRFWGRATSGRTDGSLVRLTIPITGRDIQRAEADVHRFAEDFVPRLAGHIPL